MLTCADLIATYLTPRERGSSSGITALDHLTAGLRPGQVWLVTGQSQSGRSTLALQVARLAAELGVPSAFLAGSDTALRLAGMLMSAASGIPRLSPISDIHRGDFGGAVAHLRDMSLTVHYPEGRRLGELLPAIGSEELVVVDDLDLWEPSPAAALEAVAQLGEMGHRVLVTAPESMMTGLTPTEATAWARAADLRMRLIRHGRGPREGEIDLDVSHHRDGPSARVAAAFQGALSRIVDLE